MNFWKILRKLLEEMFPDWQEQFISYKALKKQLKSIYPDKGSSGDLGNDERLNKRPRLDRETEMEMTKDFLKLLIAEIKKINSFFMDKEEEFIIELKLLKAEAEGVKDSKDELMKLGKKMVDIHGEMILLKNYSALNYIGLLKILKKYDKRSGDVIRLPFILKVLQQPFFRTEVINSLVHECEALICNIFSRHEQLLVPPVDGNGGSEEETGKTDGAETKHDAGSDECMENQYLKLSRSALDTLRLIRSRSSTINVFSLPPMEV